MFKESLAGYSCHVGIRRDGFEKSTGILSAAKKLLWEGMLRVFDAHLFASSTFTPFCFLKHREVKIKSHATILGVFCLCKSHPIEVSRQDEEGRGTRFNENVDYKVYLNPSSPQVSVQFKIIESFLCRELDFPPN